MDFKTVETQYKCCYHGRKAWLLQDECNPEPFCMDNFKPDDALTMCFGQHWDQAERDKLTEEICAGKKDVSGQPPETDGTVFGNFAAKKDCCNCGGGTKIPPGKSVVAAKCEESDAGPDGFGKLTVTADESQTCVKPKPKPGSGGSDAESGSGGGGTIIIIIVVVILCCGGGVGGYVYMQKKNPEKLAELKKRASDKYEEMKAANAAKKAAKSSVVKPMEGEAAKTEEASPAKEAAKTEEAESPDPRGAAPEP